MKLIPALEMAYEIKGRECSHETMLDYRSYVNNFKGYWALHGDPMALVADFKKKDAFLYLDYLMQEKKHETITRNNNLRAMKALFYILTDREFVLANPFVGIKPLKVKAKRRKVYSKIESKIIMNYLKEADKNLLLAVAFTYYMALRRTELLKLKIGDINLEKGLVLVDGTQTKNGDLDAITMPNAFWDYLKQIRIDKYPADYFVFGHGAEMNPGPKKCNENTIPNKHRAMLRKLHQYEIILDITGKSFYSWKDTSARDMIDEGVSAPALQKHLRHKDLATTQRYLECYGVSDNSIRNVKGNLF